MLSVNASTTRCLFVPTVSAYLVYVCKIASLGVLTTPHEAYISSPNTETHWKCFCLLTHWGWVTHICVSKLTTIVSDNGLSPGRRQSIIWTSGGILFIGPQGTKFSRILTEMQTLSSKKIHFKMSSWKWRPFCFGFYMLNCINDQFL